MLSALQYTGQVFNFRPICSEYCSLWIALAVLYGPFSFVTFLQALLASLYTSGASR